MNTHITIRDGHITNDTNHAITTHLTPTPEWKHQLLIQEHITNLFVPDYPQTRPTLIDIPIDSFRGICNNITTHH